MKLLIKILVGIIGLAGIALVVVLLSIDSMARAAMEASIRAQSGLDVRIKRVEIGLIRPTFRIEDFVLYNPADFGGSPLLTVPEVFIEYDRDAARAQQLHLRLARLNIAEVQVIEDAAGRTNLAAIGAILGKLQVPRTQPGGSTLQFQGTDTLNLSLGRIRKTSLRDPGQNIDINLGMQNEIVRNVRSETNLYPLLTRIAWRAGVELMAAQPQAVPAPAPRPAPALGPVPKRAGP